MSVGAAAESKRIIKPSRGWFNLQLGELWEYRELTYFLIWRDIKVRYKQTLLGASWAVLKPLVAMVIFQVIFGQVAGLPTDGVPGPLFYYSGLLPWILFQDGVTKAAASFVTGRSLVTKVYFPRLAMPLAAVNSGLMDFAISFLVLMGMMVYFRYPLGPQIITMPLFVVWALATSLGVGLWLAALNALYRDVGYITPFLLQAWFFASPIVYSAAMIPEGLLQVLYGLNPMSGVIQGFRWATLGQGQPPTDLALASLLITVVLLFSGLIFFRRMERTIADVV
ncbi:MAG: ABC transporter permease [Anaerolineales bacterium]